MCVYEYYDNELHYNGIYKLASYNFGIFYFILFDNISKNSASKNILYCRLYPRFRGDGVEGNDYNEFRFYGWRAYSSKVHMRW